MMDIWLAYGRANMRAPKKFDDAVRTGERALQDDSAADLEDHEGLVQAIIKGKWKHA
jgi:hypothetical protein